MKSSYLPTRSLLRRALTIFSLLIFAVANTHGQNLVVNSNFTGGSSTGWSTSSSLEINPQSVYGGSSSTDYATELDVERTINQKVCILPGLNYTLTFQASRRTGGGTPASPGLQVIVAGVSSGSRYVNNIQAYNNSVWSAQNNSFTFSVPAGSADKQINIQFLSNNNLSTYGVLVWDIELAPASSNSISVAGPANVSLSSPAAFSVSNAPSTAAYSWSFAGANPTSSTAAQPTGVTWSSLGTKTVSTTLSNGACTMASYSIMVTVISILPMQWSDFEGSLVNRKANLSWITDGESNGRYFIIERSVNGSAFDSVGVVTSANADAQYGYAFTDQNTEEGRLSYRLKHVDLDNHIQYSSIVSLSNDPVATPGSTSIYPNPAISTLVYSIYSEQESQVEIKVFSVSGGVVMTTSCQLTAGINRTSLNVSGLQPGTYYLSATNRQTRAKTVQTFVKG